jgi:hypothetical protein
MSVNGTAPQSDAQTETVSESPASSASSTFTPASESVPEQAPPERDWFREAFSKTRTTYVPGQQPAPEIPPASVTAPKSDVAAPPSAPEPQRQPRETPQAPSLTQAEFDRAVQAEVDRRNAKFQREEGERRRRAALEAQREQDRQLRENDPYAYAERMKQREQENEALQKQLEQTHGLLSSTVTDYDRIVLDPLLTAVPAQERQKILQEISDGLPGRGEAAIKSLKVLERHWQQQGEARARQRLMSDQSFVKEVLARYGGQRQEPEHVPARAAPGPSGGRDMNSLLRQMAGRGG